MFSKSSFHIIDMIVLGNSLTYVDNERKSDIWFKAQTFKQAIYEGLTSHSRLYVTNHDN